MPVLNLEILPVESDKMNSNPEPLEFAVIRLDQSMTSMKTFTTTKINIPDDAISNYMSVSRASK
jgi:hypothetical protein